MSLDALPSGATPVSVDSALTVAGPAVFVDVLVTRLLAEGFDVSPQTPGAPLGGAVIAYGAAADEALDGAAAGAHPIVVAFEPTRLDPATLRTAPGAVVVHAAEGADLVHRPDHELHRYPGRGPGFLLPGEDGYDRAASGVAVGRTIGALRRLLGPRLDLAALWEAHCALEFGARDAAATLQTMVDTPYVNSVAVMTGGYGQEDLLGWYRDHFVHCNPADTQIVPVSRTVGPDRIVDEVLLCFTHDIEMDWMLPGIAPTGRYLEVPFVAIVTFRGDKIAHEHIYWDQAGVLVQLGLLDPDELPVVGRAQADKLRNPSIPSNTLLGQSGGTGEGPE